MALLPPWAPNVHPLLIHFPIVLVVLAVLVDLVHLARPREGLSRLGAALGLVGVAVARANLQLFRLPEGRGLRVLYAVIGLAAAALVAQTAERGARLVYEQGVGVIQGPGTSN